MRSRVYFCYDISSSPPPACGSSGNQINTKHLIIYSFDIQLF